MKISTFDYLMTVLSLFSKEEGKFIGSIEHARVSIIIKLKYFIPKSFIIKTFKLLENKNIIINTKQKEFIVPPIKVKYFRRGFQVVYLINENLATKKVIQNIADNELENINNKILEMTTNEDIYLLRKLEKQQKGSYIEAAIGVGLKVDSFKDYWLDEPLIYNYSRKEVKAFIEALKIYIPEEQRQEMRSNVIKTLKKRSIKELCIKIIKKIKTDENITLNDPYRIYSMSYSMYDDFLGYSEYIISYYEKDDLETENNNYIVCEDYLKEKAIINSNGILIEGNENFCIHFIMDFLARIQIDGYQSFLHNLYGAYNNSQKNRKLDKLYRWQLNSNCEILLSALVEIEGGLIEVFEYSDGSLRFHSLSPDIYRLNVYRIDGELIGVGHKKYRDIINKSYIAYINAKIVKEV